MIESLFIKYQMSSGAQWLMYAINVLDPTCDLWPTPAAEWCLSDVRPVFVGCLATVDPVVLVVGVEDIEGHKPKVVDRLESVTYGWNGVW